ncbi:pseudouridine synthase, partial [Lacticaseibacillus rhamnosus MTCC 5462]
PDQRAARRHRSSSGQGHHRADGGGQDAAGTDPPGEQLQARSVSRIYEAIVIGVIITGGTVDAPIGRHGQQRQRM